MSVAGGQAALVSPCLRPVVPGDAPFLLEVYTGTRLQELEVTGWSDVAKHEFCRMQFEAQDAHYRKHYPAADFLVIEADGRAIGRLYVARWDKEIRIVDIAILPDHRGHGVGTRLLNDLCRESERVGKPLTIHVEKFNPARRLYERLGFEVIEDKGVYDLLRRGLVDGS